MAPEAQDRAEASISTSTDPSGPPVVVVLGEIDLSDCKKLLAAIDASLASAPALLILDLGGVTFMDSSGINVLVRSASSGTTIQLRNPSPLMRRVIELKGIATTLPIIS